MSTAPRVFSMSTECAVIPRRSNTTVHQHTHARRTQAPASILGVYHRQQPSAKRPRKTITVTITRSSISIQGSALPQLSCKPPDAVDSTNITIRFGE